MRVSGIQYDIVAGDPEANFALVEPMIAGEAAKGSRLVVLPEMFSTGYFVDPQPVVEPADGPSASFLTRMADVFDIWVAGSAPIADSTERVVNRLMLRGPGGAATDYDKVHPFTFAGEHLSYAAGEHLRVVDVEGVRTALFVCYDLRFAPQMWKLAPVTDLYVVVANWPEVRSSHWTALLRARAIENQAFVIGVNRVGCPEGLEHSGNSELISPLGEPLAAAQPGSVGASSGEVSAEAVAAVRQRMPFLKDRKDLP